VRYFSFNLSKLGTSAFGFHFCFVNDCFGVAIIGKIHSLFFGRKSEKKESQCCENWFLSSVVVTSAVNVSQSRGV